MTSDRLAKFSSCEISDALLKLKHPHGGLLPDIVMWSPKHQEGDAKIYGKVYIIKLVRGNDTTSPKLPSKQHFADTIPKDSIVFMSVPSDAYNAVWGGLMSTRAKKLFAKGVVIDGLCRDLNEHRTLEFPVFARGSSTLSANPFTRPSELNVPVQLNGRYDPPIIISPGDYIIADVDGVVCIPADKLEEVLTLAEKGQQVDELCRKDLEQGHGVAETFKRRRGT